MECKKRKDYEKKPGWSVKKTKIMRKNLDGEKKRKKPGWSVG